VIFRRRARTMLLLLLTLPRRRHHAAYATLPCVAAMLQASPCATSFTMLLRYARVHACHTLLRYRARMYAQCAPAHVYAVDTPPLMMPPMLPNEHGHHCRLPWYAAAMLPCCCHDATTLPPLYEDAIPCRLMPTRYARRYARAMPPYFIRR